MAKDDPMHLTTNGAEIIQKIDQLEKAKGYHEEAARAITLQLAEIRDRVNGRARKARSGKFTRRRKSAEQAPSAPGLMSLEEGLDADV